MTTDELKDLQEMQYATKNSILSSYVVVDVGMCPQLFVMAAQQTVSEWEMRPNVKI